MADITRITHGASGGELSMAANAAMVDMARMFLASQARGDVPRVALSTDGRITLTWSDGQKVSYQTEIDTSSMLVRKA